MGGRIKTLILGQTIARSEHMVLFLRLRCWYACNLARWLSEEWNSTVCTEKNLPPPPFPPCCSFEVWHTIVSCFVRWLLHRMIQCSSRLTKKCKITSQGPNEEGQGNHNGDALYITIHIKNIQNCSLCMCSVRHLQGVAAGSGNGDLVGSIPLAEPILKPNPSMAVGSMCYWRCSLLHHMHPDHCGH